MSSARTYTHGRYKPPLHAVNVSTITSLLSSTRQRKIPASGPAATGAAATSAVVPKPGGSPAPGAGPAGKAAGAGSAVAQQPAALAPANPAPYRVTIRLPQADPSAPAEVVTEALRAAGVPFEVETIERMGPGAATVPTVVPPAPQVRPAPPPR